jgi:hypothetical protein
MSLSLVADRFLPLAPALHLDLATGDRAWVRIEPAGPSEYQVQRAERAAALSTIWHPWLSDCLDYGVLGPNHWFEAYRMHDVLANGSPHLVDDARRMTARVAEFLEACGLTCGVLQVKGMGVRGERLVPGSCAGARSPEIGRTGPSATNSRPLGRSNARCSARPPSGSVGVRLVRRAAYDALVERFVTEPCPGVTITDVQAAQGAGGRTLLRQCAREARRLGWIVLGTSALRWLLDRRHIADRFDWEALVDGRHVVVLHDARQPLAADHDLPSLLLRLGTRVPRPHRLIHLVLEARSRDVLRLTPIGVAGLTSMLVIVDHPATGLRSRIDALARSSGGLPGRFLESVMSLCDRSGPSAADRCSQVVRDVHTRFGEHESSVADEAGVQVFNPQPGLDTPRGKVRAIRRSPLSSRSRHPDNGEIWRTVIESERLMRIGRHAAAERLLRHARGAHVRRGQHVAAGHVVLACGMLHAVRGRTRAAIECFSEAVAQYHTVGAGVAMAVASTWLGRAHLDLLHVDESEACLRTALSTSALADDTGAPVWAAVSLARTLWWLGRNEEACALLQAIKEDARPSAESSRIVPAPAELAIARAALAVRVASTLGDSATAAAFVAAAVERASAAGTSTAACLAQLARAHWCATLGDVPGLVDTVAAGLRLAREARQPLHGLRFRMLRCQALAHAGAKSPALADAHALRRALSRGLPDLLTARVRVALAVCADPHSAEAVIARHRLPGLASTVSPSRSMNAGLLIPSRIAMIDDVIEVLRICQEEEDARTALAEVARVVQTRTRADAVVIVTAARTRTVIGCPAGARLHVHAAQRAIESGTPVPLGQTDHGMEAAHPIRCAGAVIGAIACRWSGPASVEQTRAAALLAGVAAAVISPVQVLVDRTTVPALPGIAAELVGASSAMEEVRRAVARAADAPYAVLVQGGTGPEAHPDLGVQM